MKTKTIVGVSVLLVSCAAVAGDIPFEKGKTYSFVGNDNGDYTVEIKDVKGKWILVNAEACKRFNSNECWFNTDFFISASTEK